MKTAAEYARELGGIVTDEEHWGEIGVHTAEDLRHYLAVESYVSAYKDAFGMKPRDEDLNEDLAELSVEEIEAMADQLADIARDKSGEERDERLHGKDPFAAHQAGSEPDPYEMTPKRSGFGRRVESSMKRKKRLKETRKMNRYAVSADTLGGGSPEDVSAALRHVFPGKHHSFDITKGRFGDSELEITTHLDPDELGSYPGVSVKPVYLDKQHESREQRIYVTGGQLKRMIKEMLDR